VIYLLAMARKQDVSGQRRVLLESQQQCHI
jgi:hypothetical protein